MQSKQVKQLSHVLKMMEPSEQQMSIGITKILIFKVKAILLVYSVKVVIQADGPFLYLHQCLICRLGSITE